MTITDIFDAVRDGTYKDFKKYYSGNANLVDKDLGLNLLQFALTDDENPKEKLKIIRVLLKDGADVNFLDKKSRRNALHQFYFSVMRPTPDYMFTVTKLLVEHGVNLNAEDKYGAIPLKYAITLTKLDTEDIKTIYQYLIKQDSDYNHTDKFEKSCIDYATEYNWRNGFIDIVKEFENAKK